MAFPFELFHAPLPVPYARGTLEVSLFSQNVMSVEYVQIVREYWQEIHYSLSNENPPQLKELSIRLRTLRDAIAGLLQKKYGESFESFLERKYATEHQTDYLNDFLALRTNKRLAEIIEKIPARPFEVSDEDWAQTIREDLWSLQEEVSFP